MLDMSVLLCKEADKAALTEVAKELGIYHADHVNGVAVKPRLSDTDAQAVFQLLRERQ